MKRWLTIPLLTLLVIVSRPEEARAWAEHHLITRAAVESLPELAHARVTVTALAPLLKKFGHDSVRAFNESLQIKKEYDFAFQMGERPGDSVSAIDVLSKYSDEPDWGMDRELFGDEEYPEIWKSQYALMGGKRCTPSQAFRHMYWKEFDWDYPLETFHLPLSELTDSMGEAPVRARLFMELARKAQAQGDEYWHLRFIANALHYLEDVSQPFHTSQIPTKKFLFMPFVYGDVSNLVEEVQNIVAYYHFAFEDYVSHLMLLDRQGGNAEGAQFRGYVATGTAPESLAYSDRDMEAEVKAMAEIAVSLAADAGSAALDFFPEMKDGYDTKPKADPNACGDQDALDDAWWKETLANGQSDSDEKNDYFDVVSSMFQPLGGAVRAVVKAELEPPRAPTP